MSQMPTNSGGLFGDIGSIFADAAKSIQAYSDLKWQSRLDRAEKQRQLLLGDPNASIGLSVGGYNGAISFGPLLMMGAVGVALIMLVRR